MNQTWRCQIDFTDAWGRTPLHWAVAEVIQQLLKISCGLGQVSTFETIESVHLSIWRHYCPIQTACVFF